MFEPSIAPAPDVNHNYEARYGAHYRPELEKHFRVRSIQYGFQLAHEEEYGGIHWNWYYRTGSLVEVNPDAYTKKVGVFPSPMDVVGVVLDRQHELRNMER